MDGLKISQLQARYGLNSKQAVYDRIHQLNIVPIKKGYVSTKQLELLDKLDKHLKSGGLFKDFPITPEIEPSTLEKLDNPVESPVDIYLKTFDWMRSIIEQAMSHLAQANHNKSPLANFEELEKAIAFKWILPTSVVAQLIDVRPKGEVFYRGSFSFHNVGKMGRESAWQVLKAEVVHKNLI